jgi:hypothetical protein
MTRKKLNSEEPIYLLWENGAPLDTGKLTAYKSIATARTQRTSYLRYQSGRRIDIIPYYPGPLYRDSPNHCENCVFLGTYVGTYEERADLYFCRQGGNYPTVMAVYSSEPGDYASGIHFRELIPELKRAYEIAAIKGLIGKSKTDENS